METPFTGHPNVKAFISHGGLLGTTEAVHCGVPTIVMPQFGDQHTNARALEANGGGVILQLYDVTEERVYKALKKVLSSEWVFFFTNAPSHTYYEYIQNWINSIIPVFINVDFLN